MSTGTTERIKKYSKIVSIKRCTLEMGNARQEKRVHLTFLQVHIWNQTPRSIIPPGVAQSVQWLASGWTTEGQSSSPGRVKNFLFSKSSRPALGSTQPPIQWAPGVLSPWVKRQGREADHSPPVSAEVKKMWIYTSTPLYTLMVQCLIRWAQGHLNFSILQVHIYVQSRNADVDNYYIIIDINIWTAADMRFVRNKGKTRRLTRN
jgi:hypothetical protein